MNFIDRLPPLKDKTAVILVVDRLMKYTNFSTISHPYTAKSVADALCMILHIYMACSIP